METGGFTCMRRKARRRNKRGLSKRAHRSMRKATLTATSTYTDKCKKRMRPVQKEGHNTYN